jgi:hypothetical protein
MSQLTINETSGDFTHVAKLDHNDLVSIGNGGTRKLFTIPAGAAVDLAAVVNSVDISGSSTLQIDVGTTLSDPNEFIKDLDVDAMTVFAPTFNTGASFVQAAGNTTIAGGSLPVGGASADTAVYIKITDSAAASIAAGEVVIGIRLIDLSRFF